MRNLLVATVSAGVLVLAPAAAEGASGCATNAIYCIPPATPVATAHQDASGVGAYLASFTPSELAAKGSVKLNVAVSGPGTITIVVTAKLHGKTVVIGSGSAAAGSSGGVPVKLVLTKAGMAALAHAGKLRLSVRATFKPKHGKTTTGKSKTTLA